MSVSRLEAAVLLFAVALYLVGFLGPWMLHPFTIEDAGISFAYAKNLALGHGLVPFPGGERVEGFSNPSWVVLLALLFRLGVDPDTGAKALGLVAGALSLPLSWAVVRSARPARGRDVALLAPLVLACSAQFVIWNASGLENGLFGLLLLAGIVRLQWEVERPAARPLSALLFALLAVTRPEALALGAFAAAARVLAAPKPAKRTLVWLTVLLLPLLVFEVGRIVWFAAPLPNTYYAKLGHDGVFEPFGWNGRGWVYLRSWFTDHHLVFALPLLALAMTGTRERAAWLSVGLLGLLTLLLTWDGAALAGGAVEDADRLWVQARVWAIPLVCAALALGGSRLPGGRVRGLLWVCATFGLFFALYSGGDWMRGHRWFSLVVPTLLPLWVIGVGEVLDVVLPVPMDGRLRWLVAGARWSALAAIATAWGHQESSQLAELVNKPEITVARVRERLDHLEEARQRLGLDHVVSADVDMGANLFLTDWEIVDMAGLVDVPFALRPDYPPAFVTSYLLEERRPDFIHLHGGWAKRTRIADLWRFLHDYLELPPAPTSIGEHHGNYVRKDLFVRQRVGPGPDPTWAGHGIVLETIEIPAPSLPPGGTLRVQTTWQLTRMRDRFRARIWLDDGAGHSTSAESTPRWDWYPPERWLPGEQVAWSLNIPVPVDLPRGTYGVHVEVLTDSEGEGQAPPLAVVQGAAGPVQVVSREEATRAVEAGLVEARELLAQGACDAGWRRWSQARWHLPPATGWVSATEAALHQEAAACWIGRAGVDLDINGRAEALRSARRWAPEHEGLGGIAARSALALMSQAEEQESRSDWEGALKAWVAAVHADPTRSWARRRAEAARSRVLELDQIGRPLDLVSGGESSALPAGWWARDAAVETDDAQLLGALGYVDGVVPPAGRDGVVVGGERQGDGEVILVVSAHAPEAVLMDRGGAILHRWAASFDELWPERDVPRGNLSRAYWRRARLLADGDLLVIFEGLGLARLDRDSHPRWALAEPIHHDILELEDGRLLALSRRVVRSSRIAPDAPIVDDLVVELSASGERLRAWSLLDAIGLSDQSWLLGWLPHRAGDLLHTNDLERVGEHLAARLDGVGPDDVLLSLRELDTLLTLDLSTGRVSWAARGGWKRQHDPDILEDGRILLFDNEGGTGGRSRVLEFDPTTGEERTPTGTGEGIFSPILGAVQRLPAGSTLISESTSGRALEVDADGVVRWEYRNPHRAGSDADLVALLLEATWVAPSEVCDWLDAVPCP